MSLRIGQAAAISGLSAKTIRYYESIGLLRPAGRTESGYRLYRDPEIGRLAFIREARRLGFSLREIRRIVDLRDQSGPPCLHVTSLLEQKIAGVNAMLAGLAEFRGELERLRRRADAVLRDPAGTACVCEIIEGS